MRIEGVNGEVQIVLSIKESRKLIVDHGEGELVIPEIEDPIRCLFDITIARLRNTEVAASPETIAAMESYEQRYKAGEAAEKERAGNAECQCFGSVTTMRDSCPECGDLGAIGKGMIAERERIRLELLAEADRIASPQQDASLVCRHELYARADALREFAHRLEFG